MAGVVARNIRALREARERFEAQKSIEARIADRITTFTGSIWFVVTLGLLVVAWIVVNTGVVPRLAPFDPFPFVLLAMLASVAAIFLTTFVLISQNRISQLEQRRADLDLQVTLLAEHEITRLVVLVDAIAERLGVSEAGDPYLEELKKDVAPEQVLGEIEREEGPP